MSRVGMSSAWQETQLDTGRMERLGAAPISARVTLRDLLTIAWHDRKRIGAAVLAGLLLTLLAALSMPRNYSAEASLLLRLGREYLYVPETGDPSTAQPLPYDREQTLVAEAKILTSRDVLESVVAQLGVATVYPQITTNRTATQAEQAEATKALGRAIKADLLKGSNLLQVSFRHPDAETSARVLDQVIDSYLLKRRDVFASSSGGQAEAELAARRIQLNTAEARLASFKQARGIRSFSEEQSLLLAQRSEIERRQTETNLALAQADGRRAALAAQLGQLPVEVKLQRETARGEAAEAARKLLLDLQLKEREASSKFFDGEAQVQDVRADIERVKAHLRMLEQSPPEAVRTGRSPVRDGAESDLVRSAADLSQSRRGLTALAAQISVALDNAQLFEQSRQRANEMSFLFTVTTAAAAEMALQLAETETRVDGARAGETRTLGTLADPGTAWRLAARRALKAAVATPASHTAAHKSASRPAGTASCIVQ